MFSLIITIVSIALVAALALATLYYGGSAIERGNASARATELLTQSQQLLAAADLYRADKGAWPPSMEALVEQGYLRQVPQYTAAADSTGFSRSAVAAAASAITWEMPAAGKPTFVLAGVTQQEVCKEVNRKSRGDNGILKKAYTSAVTQCYGELSALKVVVSREPDALGTILPADSVDTGRTPGESEEGVWTVKPGAKNSAAGNGTPAGSAGKFEFSSVQSVSPYADLTQTGGTYSLLQRPIYRTAQAENNGALGGALVITLTNVGEAAPIPSEMDALHVAHGNNLDPSLCKPGETLGKDESCTFYVVGYNKHFPEIGPVCTAPVVLFGNQLPRVTLDTCLYTSPYIELGVNSSPTERNNVLSITADTRPNDAIVVSVISHVADLSDVSLELVNPSSLSLTGTDLSTGEPYLVKSRASGTIFTFSPSSEVTAISMPSGSGFVSTNFGYNSSSGELNTNDLTATSCALVPAYNYCNLLYFMDPFGQAPSPGQLNLTYRVKFRVNGGPLQTKELTQPFKWGLHNSGG